LNRTLVSTIEKEDSGTYVLKDNEYFVMGDNRRESFDSRSWGILPRDLIIGTPFIRLYPLDKISLLPGNYKEAK
jgi:signal peptidase I